MDQIATAGLDNLGYILAALGACAWIPQVPTLWNKYISKPKISITAKSIELGFDLNGPLLNMNLALLSQNKSGTIGTIKAIITHEDKQETTFEWSTIASGVENKSTDNNGGTITNRSSVEALMLHLPLDFTQVISLWFFSNLKKARFDNIIFPFEYKIDRMCRDNQLDNEALEKYLKNNTEWTNVKDLIPEMFTWKAGKYKLTLLIEALDGKISYTPQTFKFKINTNSAEILKDNIETTLHNMNETLICKINPTYQKQNKAYYWQNFMLEKC
ncbi:hypothetical protein [Maridesulfovibrio ferrireducens]|uniref:hypothetical protein n=1 Tax=Maridesulfovibrio ferrireducens TaxID=246191 RepID=UPI001A2978E3|nr:hypothetical protein [Maridesulfovibrio ferrireducens]MBI9111945.1 hypothetical protein [Maridesulfovibrio ferrireducens]